VELQKKTIPIHSVTTDNNYVARYYGSIVIYIIYPIAYREWCRFVNEAAAFRHDNKLLCHAGISLIA